jgi:hypothetical protein
MAYYFGKTESLCGIGVKSLCPHAFLLYRRLVSLTLPSLNDLRKEPYASSHGLFEINKSPYGRDIGF